jgi:hypothetical protein
MSLSTRGSILQGWMGKEETSRCIPFILRIRMRYKSMYSTTHRKYLNTRNHNIFQVCWGADKSLAFLIPIFLFAAQPKEFFLDGLKKLEQ